MHYNTRSVWSFQGVRLKAVPKMKLVRNQFCVSNVNTFFFFLKKKRWKFTNFSYTRFFYISNNFVSNARLKLAKIKHATHTLRLNISYLRIIIILYPLYDLKIIGHILKYWWRSKRVFIHDITRLMKMMKIKNRSYRYDRYRPSSRHGRKYSKYKKCLSIMMLICMKQHLKLNSWKVQQHWSWVEKKVLLIKKACIVYNF